MVSSGLFLIDSEANIAGALDRMRTQESGMKKGPLRPLTMRTHTEE
ncbi:metal RND transporter [Salmonella enterica]|nr:metal RND transporter [Salmonella enterica]